MCCAPIWSDVGCSMMCAGILQDVYWWYICELSESVLVVLFRYSQMSTLFVSCRKRGVFATNKRFPPTPLPKMKP